MQKILLIVLTAAVVLGLGALTAWVWPAWAVPRSTVHVTDPREIPWLDQKPVPQENLPLGELKSARP